MVGKFIHGALQRWCQKACHIMLHSTFKVLKLSDIFRFKIITVFLHSGKEPCHRLHKSIIVHNCIPLVSTQPVSRVAVMFCQNHCLWVGFLYGITEFSPELMVIFRTVSQICRNIQSPAIGIIRWRNPFCSHMKNIIMQCI